jgi:hypothetical protein
MALRLLTDEHAFTAYQLLRDQHDAARPVLEDLVRNDSRFRSMAGEVRGWGRPRYDVALTILFEWDSDYAVEEALQAVESSDPKLRALAGRLLASTGTARFTPTLLRLTRDVERDVCDAVGEGLSDGIGFFADEEDAPDRDLTLTLFDYMRDCALRTDRGPGHRFAVTLFRADRDRAARELGAPDALSIHCNWLEDVLAALRTHGVVLPAATVRTLLRDAIAILDRPEFTMRDHPGISRLVSELLVALAKHDGAAANVMMKSLSAHRQEEARKGAQDAREQLSTVDPVRVAIEANEAAGGTVSKMRREHRVVYLAWLLDAEVANGGWLQWAANPSGAYAAETLAALRELGLDAAVTQLQMMIDALGGDGSSPDQKRRMAAIDRAIDADRPMPDDGTMWAMSLQLRAAIQDYAEARPDAFGATDSPPDDGPPL